MCILYSSFYGNTSLPVLNVCKLAAHIAAHCIFQVNTTWRSKSTWHKLWYLHVRQLKLKMNVVHAQCKQDIQQFLPELLSKNLMCLSSWAVIVTGRVGWHTMRFTWLLTEYSVPTTATNNYSLSKLLRNNHNVLWVKQYQQCYFTHVG